METDCYNREIKYVSLFPRTGVDASVDGYARINSDGSAKYRQYFGSAFSEAGSDMDVQSDVNVFWRSFC